MIKDDPHTGRPVEATSEEMCQKLESLILADRRKKVSRLGGRDRHLSRSSLDHYS